MNTVVLGTFFLSTVSTVSHSPGRILLFFPLVSSLFLKCCCFRLHSVLNLPVAAGKVGGFSSIKMPQLQIVRDAGVCLLVDAVRGHEV